MNRFHIYITCLLATVLLLLPFSRCSEAIAAGYTNISLSVDTTEHQFGDKVNFYINVSKNTAYPLSADAYIALAFPDAPSANCIDFCQTRYTFESLGSGFGQPGMSNVFSPVVTSWKVEDISVPLTLDMGTYPVGDYVLYAALTSPGASVVNYFDIGSVTFSLHSNHISSGEYPGTLLFHDPPVIDVPIDSASLPASVQLSVPQLDAAGYCHLGSIGMLLNYFGAHTNTFEMWVMSGLGTCARYDSYSGQLIPHLYEWTSGIDRNYLGNFNAPYIVKSSHRTVWGKELYEVASGKIHLNDADHAQLLLKAALAWGYPVMVHTDIYEFRNSIPQCATAQPGASDFQVVTGYDGAGVRLNLTFPDMPGFNKKDLFVDWDSFMRGWKADYQISAIREPFWMLILTGQYRREDPSEIIAWLKSRGSTASAAIIGHANKIASGSASPTSVKFGEFWHFRRAFAWFLRNAGRIEAAEHYEAAAQIWGQLDYDYVNVRPLTAADVSFKLMQIANEESLGLSKL